MTDDYEETQHFISFLSLSTLQMGHFDVKVRCTCTAHNDFREPGILWDSSAAALTRYFYCVHSWRQIIDRQAGGLNSRRLYVVSIEHFSLAKRNSQCFSGPFVSSVFPLTRRRSTWESQRVRRFSYPLRFAAKEKTLHVSMFRELNT